MGLIRRNSRPAASPSAKRAAAKRNPGGLVESIKTIVYAGLIAVGIRTVLFEPFNIPSGSMIPTLLVGDYLFVSKYSYGYSHFSLPFSPPIFSGRIFAHLPNRGDVAVFKLPRDTKTDYIKRIIGLPGDRIQVRGGQLYINGAIVPRERAGNCDADDTGVRMLTARYLETLPNGVKHYICKEADEPERGSYGGFDRNNTSEYLVPAGHFFAMGDNRDNSQDSRYMNEVGYVPLENLVGRAEFLFFSIDADQPWWAFWGLAGRDPLEPAVHGNQVSAAQRPPPTEDGAPFEALLGHRFARPELLREALTHRSALQGRNRRGVSNERLEFIGDRVLGLLVAEWLAERFPDEQEGGLGPRLAHLVSQPVLAAVADATGLAAALAAGEGEVRAGVKRRATVLADALEATIGALYLDGGLDVARGFVRRVWNDATLGQAEPPTNAKSILQEWALARGLKLPVYELVSRGGPPHDPRFTIAVTVGGVTGRGEAGSKRAAEQDAAAALLAALRA